MFFFVYGSLISPQVLAHATGIQDSRSWTRKNANLRGYQRFKVKHQLYPGIQRCPEESVDGVVVDIPEQHLQIATDKLDIFEDVQHGLYMRVLEKVEVEGGEEIEAWVYIFTGPQSMVTSDRWSYEEFEQRQNQFLSEYSPS